MKKMCSSFFWFCTLSFLITTSSNATVVGDVNNDGKVDLIETIYSLKILAGIADPLIPTTENESNDTIDEANPIELSNSVSGNIGASKDIDFYKLHLPQNGILDISVTSIPDNINIAMKLFDIDKKDIATFGAGPNGESRFFSKLLGSGTYYLQLHDNWQDATSPNSYELKLELDTTDTHELNGSIDDSASINIGDTVNGSIRPKDDTDFYTFQLSEEGILDISVTSMPDNVNIEMKLFDGDKKQIATFGAGAAGENRTFARLVDAGTYYLQLYDHWQDASSEKLYALKLGLDTTDTHELNGSLDDSASINIGDTVNGSIRPKDDTDFYIFEISQDATLHISLTSVPDDINIEMKLFDGNRSHIKTFPAGNLGENRFFDYPVSAGTYYLQLYDHWQDASNSDLYDLKVTLTP